MSQASLPQSPINPPPNQNDEHHASVPVPSRILDTPPSHAPAFIGQPSSNQPIYNRPGKMIPTQYIKGLAISRPKVVEFFDLGPNSPLEESTIHEIIRWLDRDSFMFIACGVKRDGTHRLVIVLDKDDDEDALKERPSKPFGPSLDAAMPVLDGPDIWERTS